MLSVDSQPLNAPYWSSEKPATPKVTARQRVSTSNLYDKSHEKEYNRRTATRKVSQKKAYGFTLQKADFSQST